MFFWGFGFGHQATNLIVTDSDDLYEPCPFAQAVQKNLNDVKDRASKALVSSFDSTLDILFKHVQVMVHGGDLAPECTKCILLHATIKLNSANTSFLADIVKQETQ